MFPMPLMIGAALLLLLRSKASTAGPKTAMPVMRTSTGQAMAYRTPTDVAGEFARGIVAQVFNIAPSATAQAIAAQAARADQRESGANAVKWGDPYYQKSVDPTSYAVGGPSADVQAILYADAIASGPVYLPADDLQGADYVSRNWGGVW